MNADRGPALHCPYCLIGAIWTTDEGATCTTRGSGGAPGCGGRWDACGNPLVRGLPDEVPNGRAESIVKAATALVTRLDEIPDSDKQRMYDADDREPHVIDFIDDLRREVERNV